MSDPIRNAKNDNDDVHAKVMIRPRVYRKPSTMICTKNECSLIRGWWGMGRNQGRGISRCIKAVPLSTIILRLFESFKTCVSVILYFRKTVLRRKKLLSTKKKEKKYNILYNTQSFTDNNNNMKMWEY